MEEVIAYGRPDAGMTPFGRAYNPEGLSKSEIDYLVTFMRYSWDDRFEAPPIKPLFPALAAGEVPSYDVHIQPIVKRYCLSCHRAGKTNNNYLMTSYDEMLTTGDNKDKNILAGDPDSYLLQVIQGHADSGSERSLERHDPRHAADQQAEAQYRGCFCALDHGGHAADGGRGGETLGNADARARERQARRL